jgi:hypothetical protein
MSTNPSQISGVVRAFMVLGDTEGRLELISSEDLTVQWRLWTEMEATLSKFKEVVENDLFSKIPKHLYPLAQCARAWGRAGAMLDYRKIELQKGLGILEDLLEASRAVTVAHMAMEKEISLLTNPS